MQPAARNLQRTGLRNQYQKSLAFKPLDLPRLFKGITSPVLDTSLQDVLSRATTKRSAFNSQEALKSRLLDSQVDGLIVK